MNLHAFTIVLVALLSACASNPTQEYKDLLDAPDENEQKTLSAAIQNTPATTLRKGEGVHFDIEVGNPKLNLDGVRSFYHLFEASDAPESHFEIKTFSEAKTGPAGGLGPIYVIWPRVFILDTSGAVLSE